MENPSGSSKLFNRRPYACLIHHPLHSRSLVDSQLGRISGVGLENGRGSSENSDRRFNVLGATEQECLGAK